MSQHHVRVVVGEGQSMRQGLLRFVLEGDGFEVVGEAATSAELARVLAIHQPDVVVLDDGIGATAVQMAHEVAPRTKVILVWPGAVVPIGGDARVEPSEVLRDLGGAVAHVAGVPIPAAEGFIRPDWVERVRKDPAALREMLAARGGIESRRPSITELQRRGRRLHPGAAAASAATDEAAAVVILPVGTTTGRPGAGSDEPVIVLPDAVAAATVTPLPDRPTRERERDRKLGTMALGGAAAAGILVLALVLGGSRIEGHLSAEPPNSTPPTGVVNPPTGPGNQPGNPGGPQNPGTGGGPTTSPGGTIGGGGAIGDGTNPFTRGQFGTTGGGQTAGFNGGGTPPPTAMPGRSALHNPHGGPPGHLDDDTPGHSDQHGHAGSPPGHSTQHGQGAAHKNAHAPTPHHTS
jgi:hypothetical protein